MKEKLIEVLRFMESSFRKHYSCEDPWYSCPAHPGDGVYADRTGKECDCGADKYNKELQLNINKLKEVINESN